MAHRTLNVPSDTGMGTIDLDAHVRELLPINSTISKSQIYRTAAWTRAAKIIVFCEDGTEVSYFVKCATGEVGKLMLEGEYNALSRIAEFSPDLVPKLYGTGQFRDSSIPTYFLLMEFLDLETGAPEPVDFGKQLADLHARSVSPTGKFGYPMVTCQGPIPQNISWHANWSVFYARMLSEFFERELATNGPSQDGKYEAEIEKLIVHTIPNLLGPLQTDGRTIKPSLVHGDLWEENCGTVLESGQPKIFDPAAFYAHNEYEFGMWRINCPMGRMHYRHYFRHIPPSEPKEQWEDRNKVYCIKPEVACSVLWPAVHDTQRKLILELMVDLNSKYANDTVMAGARQKA